jgi:DNA primase
MMTEGVTFPEAVERLASMAACRCRARRPRRSARRARKTLHDIVELAARFFETMLAARTGAKARGYLADRGLEPKTQL